MESQTIVIQHLVWDLKVEMMSKQLIFIVKGINHTRIYILAEIVFEDYNVGFPEKGEWQTKYFTKDSQRLKLISSKTIKLEMC